MNGPKLVGMKKLRISLGMTQETFAKSFGLSKSTYNNYETGSRDPGVLFLKQVADKYNVTVDFILGRSNDPKKTYSEEVEDSISNEIELRLLSNYRSLNEEGQEKLVEYSDDLASMNKYKKSDKFILDSKEA